MPGLEIVQEVTDLDQGMDCRIHKRLRIHIPGRRRRGRKESFQVNPVEVARFLGLPQRGVGEKLDIKIGNGIAQRASDPFRVVVGFQVFREARYRLAAQG